MGIERYGTNSGHGHVWKRPDGTSAKCGGPAICRECAADKALLVQVPPGARTLPDRKPKPNEWEERVHPAHCGNGRRVDPDPGLGD